MPISRELIDILACPKCKGSLIYKEEECFICKGCRLLYPVRDGIPVMLIEEALPFEDTGADDLTI